MECIRPSSVPGNKRAHRLKASSHRGRRRLARSLHPVGGRAVKTRLQDSESFTLGQPEAQRVAGALPLNLAGAPRGRDPVIIAGTTARWCVPAESRPSNCALGSGNPAALVGRTDGPGRRAPRPRRRTNRAGPTANRTVSKGRPTRGCLRVASVNKPGGRG